MFWRQASRITQHCSGCIGFHVKALIKLGCSKQGLEEMLTVCVYMGGGPALMYTAEALAAFEAMSVADAEEAVRNAQVVVDVREADEFAAGHVPGAAHISRGIGWRGLAGDGLPEREQPQRRL